MSVYGNLIIDESCKLQNTIETIDTLFESVVYNEYINYSKLLSECTNYEDKIILESKVMVLQEVSLKDIKNTIFKVLKLIKDKINDFIIFIKTKFRSKELKKAQNDIKDLKEKMEDLERERDKANKDKAKETDDKRFKLSNSLNTLLDTIRNNKIIYFNMFDYIDDNKRITYQYYLRNFIKKLDTAKNLDKFKYVKEEIIKSYGENLTILNDNIFKSKFGGKNTSMSKDRIRSLIKEDLSHKDPVNRDNLINYLTESAKKDNTGYCYDFGKQMKENISTIENSVSGFFKKNINMSRGPMPFHPLSNEDEDIEENYSNIEYDIIKYYKSLIFDLKCNMDYMITITEFEGKRIGAVIGAAEAANNLTEFIAKNM